MKNGTMLRPGDLVLLQVQFVDRKEVKRRPAVVLYTEFDNVVVAGVTSNTRMHGIPLTIAEGAKKESIIKLNYVFTVAEQLITKTFFRLTAEKRRIMYIQLHKKISGLLAE